jgi:hypothetical protein
VTAALEYAMAAKQRQGTRLSVEFLNWAARAATDRTQDGGFFSEIWKGFEAYGICPEDEFPYQPQFDAGLKPNGIVLHHAKDALKLGLVLRWIKEWDVTTGVKDSQITEIKSTLAAHTPVFAGLRWPKRAAWRDGVLEMCGPDDVYDGHSVLLTGYRDEPAQPGGGLFLIRNSGADGSAGALPYAYVTDYLNDAAWIGPQEGGESS